MLKQSTFIALIFTALGTFSANAQDSGMGTNLLAVAEDGSTHMIRQVYGRFEVEPAQRSNQRFGRIRVHSGLAFRARATEATTLPLYAVGTFAHGMIRVAENSGAMRIDSMHRAGRSRVRVRLNAKERMVFPSIVMSSNAVRSGDQNEVGGEPEVTGGLQVERRTRLCARPGRECVAIAFSQGIFAQVSVEGRWTEIHFRDAELEVRGFVPTAALINGGRWHTGHVGGLGDGCPAYGISAILEPNAPVHRSAEGPRFARAPEEPESAYIIESTEAWLQIVTVPGMQIRYPSTTCETGWVRREHVRFGVHRAHGIRIDREGEAYTLRELPEWLEASGMRAGDQIVALEGETYRQPAQGDPDRIVRWFRIGGRFRVLREGTEQSIDVPLAPGCQPAGQGQPSSCRPR